MKIGIVGFEKSGKTTLFKALTGKDVPSGYGAGRINLGTIKVHDPRVDRLAELDNPRKITYAEITFADVPGGSGGKSLDPQTLGRIREMDALVQVVRGFDNGLSAPNPLSEIRDFEAELLLADMQVAEKRVERLQKDRSDPRQLKILETCLKALGDLTPLRQLELGKEDLASLSGFAFLSLKPLMIVVSQPEGAATEELDPVVVKEVEQKGLEVMALSGPIEAEIAALAPDDQKEFLADIGLEEPASARFIRTAYAMLDLISFLTHGEDECRAWPVRRGSTALEAAGAVHSDIARGFIRAEVIHFADFDQLKSESACRDAGKLRVEGKSYVVQDGDICHFRFNV